MYYGEQQKLGLTEFTDVFYDRLSRVIVNSSYIEDNQEFFDHILWKFYDRYLNAKTEIYTINMLITTVEIFLDSLLKFKPDLELPEDTITLR